MAKKMNKSSNSRIKSAKNILLRQNEINKETDKNPLNHSTGKVPKEKINFEIENIEFLLQRTLSHWKENLDSENIKADTIGDLEKLIKLRILLIDENEQKRIISEKLMVSIIGIIKDVIDDPALRIKLLTRLKEIDIDDSGSRNTKQLMIEE